MSTFLLWVLIIVMLLAAFISENAGTLILAIGIIFCVLFIVRDRSSHRW